MDSDIDAGKMVSMIRDKYCEGSNVRFAEMMGESKTTVSNWCNADSLGKQVLVKLLLKFEKLDANWLLLGRGEMEKQSSETVSEDNLNTNDMELKTLLDVIRRQNARLDELERENADLRRKYEPSEERPAV